MQSFVLSTDPDERLLNHVTLVCWRAVLSLAWLLVRLKLPPLRSSYCLGHEFNAARRVEG